MCMFLATSVFAIDITIGGAAGVNTSFMTGSDWTDMLDAMEANNSFMKFGFEIGAFADIAINDLFSIQPEVNFLLLRYGSSDLTWQGKDVKPTLSMKVFEIAVLPKFNFNNFSVFLGPAVQFVLGDLTFKDSVTSGSAESETVDVPTDKSVVFSGIFGAGYAMPMGNGNLMFDARYRRAFASAIDDFNGRLNTISLRVGYGFGL